MSTIVDSIASQSTQNISGAAAEDLKGQFLELLVTQLKNQDPTKPVENEEFVSQLAQLTALEQQQQITETNSALLLQSSLSTGASLIGKTVSGHETIGDQTFNVEGEVNSIAVENGQVVYKVVDADGGVHNMRADQLIGVSSGL